MSQVEVSTQIPQKIADGMQSGIYQRIGGAILEIDSRQIVAWLREAYDLSEPVVSDLLSLSSTATGPNPLNMALSTMEFAVVLKRLDHIEKQLKGIQAVLDAINYKIDLSFYANFRAALDLAANTFTMANSETRRVSSMQAINRFLEAEHHYADLADIEIANQSQVADDYLSTLCLAYVTEVRCYLELDEMETAVQRLQDGLNNLRPRFEKHIDTLLTSNPAAYLHPSLKQWIDLKRLTNIYRWISADVDASAVFEAQRANLFKLAQDPQEWLDSLPPAIRLPVKSRFFNPQFISAFAGRLSKRKWAAGLSGLIDALPSKGKKRPTSQEKKSQNDGDNDAFELLPETMHSMEAMIETFSRFETYLAELKAVRKLGVTFQHWRQLAPTDRPVSGDAKLLYITMP